MQLNKFLKTGGLAALAIALVVPTFSSEAAAADAQWRNKGERSAEHQRGNDSRSNDRSRPSAEVRPAPAPSPQQIDRRSEQRADRVERRGDRNAASAAQRGNYGQAARIDRQSERRADQVERRGDWRADQAAGGRDYRDNDRNRSYRDQDRNRTYRDGDRNRSYSDRNRSRWNDNRNDRRDYQRWNRDWRRDNRYNWTDYRRRNRNVFHIGVYYSPYRNYSYRRVNTGFRLDSLFFSNRYWVSDPWRYRLPEVYGPYRWVRYYDDVLLVDIYSGEVVDVIYDFFW